MNFNIKIKTNVIITMALSGLICFGMNQSKKETNECLQKIDLVSDMWKNIANLDAFTAKPLKITCHQFDKLIPKTFLFNLSPAANAETLLHFFIMSELFSRTKEITDTDKESIHTQLIAHPEYSELQKRTPELYNFNKTKISFFSETMTKTKMFIPVIAGETCRYPMRNLVLSTYAYNESFLNTSLSDCPDKYFLAEEINLCLEIAIIKDFTKIIPTLLNACEKVDEPLDCYINSCILATSHQYNSLDDVIHNHYKSLDIILNHYKKYLNVNCFLCWVQQRKSLDEGAETRITDKSKGTLLDWIETHLILNEPTNLIIQKIEKLGGKRLQDLPTPIQVPIADKMSELPCSII